MLLNSALDRRKELPSRWKFENNPKAVTTPPSCCIVLKLLDKLHLRYDTPAKTFMFQGPDRMQGRYALEYPTAERAA